MYDNFARHQEGQRPVILFTSLPNLEQLLAITVKITNSSNSTKFQPQIIKCREFIFTEPETIGTPSADVYDNCFHLVAQAAVMKSGRIQARINRVGLQVTQPYPVTPDLYQSCLKYTLQARISPNWNKVGQWFLEGRDFLTLTGCLNGIKMDLTMNQSELFFTLEATTFKTSPIKVMDLDIPSSKLNTFLTDPAAEIYHHDIASDWCFILPSMKKGRIISITHDLPEECPFMTYRDLKRHWKNMYGFRLPDDDSEINYYQINFGSLGGKLFTYPEVCLRGRELQRLSRIDPKPIMRTFMQEVQSKFPTVCGFPFKLQSKAKFTSTDLLMSSQAPAQTAPNLTNKMGNQKSVIYRSKDDVDKLRYFNSHQLPRDNLQHSQLNTTSTNMNQNRALLSSNNNDERYSESRTVCENKNQPVTSHTQNTQSVAHNIPSATSSQPPRMQMISSGGHQKLAHIGQKSRKESQESSKTTDTPTQNLPDQQNQGLARKLFPSFHAKKSLFKNSDSDQNNNQKVVPKFTVSKRPYGIVSATSSAKLTVPVASSASSHSSGTTSFNEFRSGKPSSTTSFNLSSESLLNITSEKPGNVTSEKPYKITPRFFQKKVQGQGPRPTPSSSIVMSKPATKGGKGQPKPKTATKRTKASKEGTGGEAVKKRKLKKAEA